MRSREPHHLDPHVDRLLAGVRWTRTIGPYHALDFRFGVRTCDPALASYLSALIEPFAVDGPRDDLLWLSALERRTEKGRRFVAYAGARRLTATRSQELVLASLLWGLNREAVGRAKDCIVLHASAAERDGVVVVLPAARNSGKTTLCAGLLCRGYRYVTDEALAVDVATGRIRPYPKALSLDPGAWPLFPDLAPLVEPEQESYLGAQWHIPAARLGAEIADRAVGAPRVLLSPSYALGAETVVTPLRPAEGVVLLAENSFNVASWGQRGLEVAARFVRGCDVIGRLSVGDLNAACDVVDQAVDRALECRVPEEARA